MGFDAVEKDRTYGTKNRVCVESDEDTSISGHFARSMGSVPRLVTSGSNAFLQGGHGGPGPKNRGVPKTSPEQLPEGEGVRDRAFEDGTWQCLPTRIC